MKITDREFIRFILAGAVNTISGYALYCALLLVVPFAAAYTASYVLGILISYVLNCVFVFRTRLSIGSAIKYPFVYVAQFGFGLLLLSVLVKRAGLDPKVAAMIVVFCSVPVTFLLNRLIIRPKPAGSLRAEI
jgi:putative flippase GtrA